MPKHTPGPWYVTEHHSGQRFIHHSPHETPHLRRTGIATLGSNPADADLIAAAPDMLAALKSVTQPLLIAIDEAGQCTDAEAYYAGIYAGVKAAIAKAEGGDDA